MYVSIDMANVCIDMANVCIDMIPKTITLEGSRLLCFFNLNLCEALKALPLIRSMVKL